MGLGIVSHCKKLRGHDAFSVVLPADGHGCRQLRSAMRQ
jgi:hypothetical protein